MRYFLSLKPSIKLRTKKKKNKTFVWFGLSSPSTSSNGIHLCNGTCLAHLWSEWFVVSFIEMPSKIECAQFGDIVNIIILIKTLIGSHLNCFSYNEQPLRKSLSTERPKDRQCFRNENVRRKLVKLFYVSFFSVLESQAKKKKKHKQKTNDEKKRGATVRRTQRKRKILFSLIF